MHSYALVISGQGFVTRVSCREGELRLNLLATAKKPTRIPYYTHCTCCHQEDKQLVINHKRLFPISYTFSPLRDTMHSLERSKACLCTRA